MAESINTVPPEPSEPESVEETESQGLESIGEDLEAPDGGEHNHADDAPEMIEERPPAGSEQSFGRWLLETALLVGLAFVLAQGIKTFIVQPFVIPTGSMIPTIELQDRLLAEKITYRFVRPPQPGEIVVFDNPDANDPVAKILIKRVIATEGQTVDIHDGAVYVDGQKLVEPYVYDKPTELGTVAMPIEIPQGHVWLMGDNRPNSGDSRFFGPVPVESVNGRAFWTYWPPSRFGGLE